MKVWRGLTLGFWILGLTFFLSVIAIYYSLQHTVLNAQVAKQRLAETGTYTMLRDTLLVDKTVSLFQEKYPGNTLLDQHVTKVALREVFPSQTLNDEFAPAIDGVYAWLDSKQPAITFELPLQNHQEQFYRSLEVALTDKIAGLPICDQFYYSADEAVLNKGCLPGRASPEAIGQVVSRTIRAGDFPLGASITDETFAMPAMDNALVRELPTYLNYLWVLNYIAIAIVAIVTLFLVVSRKMIGIAALGVALVLSSIVVLVIGLGLPSLVPVRSALENSIHIALIPPLQTMIFHMASIGALVGFALVTMTGVWRWRQRGKRTRG